MALKLTETQPAKKWKL